MDQMQRNPELFLWLKPVGAGGQGVLAGSRSPLGKHTLLTAQQPSNPTLHCSFQTVINDNSVKNVS